MISFSRKLVRGPRLRGLGDRECPHEIAKVAGQRVELKADGVGGKRTAWQPSPFDRALALFDRLFAGAALVVERDDALGRSRQVGDNEADTRVKLIGVPLDLRHDPPGFLPALRLIAEAGEVAAHLVRRSPDWALEQVSYLVLP